MISEELLKKYRAVEVHLKKKEVLFNVGVNARYFFQVSTGKIKMNNFNEDGKEFIQGIFPPGSSFGEPPLFAELKYPAQAEAVEESSVWRLEKESFFKLLRENPETHLKLTKVLAGRLHYKATMVAEISTESPEHRLLKLIDYFKTHIHKIPEEEEYLVELSRQQMADLTGLRVETVIRTIKSLEKKGVVQLKSHKILR
ncbi:Crp/Fnr family transcriptional regulator [Flagellimonas pacifica]|uniref:cAMP-binding domain of CRP or a regulatory subunit of cAMP-dependent protein kinases n=1 Tax=Flagellimonas pacifica TaxID=1247520 RepID=A0A285MW19_9FLAO|nr:Crp/Fnr family transcriptional regulator [Allomuricauda parva]SNZ00873.1 cAMP-binding domain of CRP or a regulatory subunit of cAMP-dependent protein kinases [Allomuricauda parva]